ncbi:hypothetical protein ACVW1C_002667 [Bradyrhizobium sp. USDA 4011]
MKDARTLYWHDRPLDAQNDLPKFLVQVKSTEKSGAPPRIKLSALKHLVDADLPAAIAVLFFIQGGKVPVRKTEDKVRIGGCLSSVMRLVVSRRERAI